MLVHELRRITVLWDELWYGTLSQHQTELSRKCQQLKNEASKLNRNVSLSQAEKTELIKKKYDIIFKPLLFVLDQLADITSASPETPNEKCFQETYGTQIETARNSLRNPESYFNPIQAVAPLKQLHHMLQQRAHRKSATTLKMADVSPTLANLSTTKIAMPGVVSHSNQIICIGSVDSAISILPTKTKPKKLSFQGSDGKRYPYLFKGLEDLHLDERIMQFLAIVNTMLTKNQRNHECVYRAHFYSVVPLGPRSGLIQWVGSATPLFGLYKRWQQREVATQSLKLHSNQQQQQQQQTPQVSRPSELFYGKLNPKLLEIGIGLDNRKEWPLPILRNVMKELIKETPSDLLARELWMISVSAGEWWKLTRTYNISTAVMSIIGYIIGLGDRHLDNLLVNLTSGEVVHIDYNVCFEKGKNLRVPEKVPFRMTHNIETALGVTGVEGVFRRACGHVLHTMRQGREILLTLLEAFIYDPLVDWTPDSEAGYAGAVYGGDQALVSGARQSRQQLERGLTLSMFAVRLTEMKAEWINSKNDVISSIPDVGTTLENWLTTHESIAEAENKLQDGHHLMAMIKEAEANPHHSLYGLYPRYEKYMRVKTAKESALELINSRKKETDNWHKMYQMATRVLFGTELRHRLELVNLGPIVTPVIDYIIKAGQSQLATQCEHTEVELKKSVTQVQNTCLNTLAQLSKYARVWSNYPANHLENHRISKQLDSLNQIQENLSREKIEQVLGQSFQDQDDVNLATYACAGDLQLNNLTLQLNTQIQKVCERIQSGGLGDSSSIMSAVNDSTNSLKSIVSENGSPGTASLTCALLNSLTQLTTSRLRADKTVSGAGEGLVDMTVGGLWWLGESVVTLGTMMEVITLLSVYSPPLLPKETTVIHSLSCLNDVFTAIQDLVTNTSQIIIVEGLRLFWCGEPSVIQMAQKLQEVVSTSPVSPASLHQNLTQHLRMTIFRMQSSYEHCLLEASQLHDKLNDAVQDITSPVDGSTEQSQGQMLLMGFHLLFGTIDEHLETLINSLLAVPLPQLWNRVDTASHAAEIMAPLLIKETCEVLKELLHVKKVETIVNFFNIALQLTPSARTDAIQGKGSPAVDNTIEEQLDRVVRTYASDCISLLLLGLPSYLSTHLLLLHSQKIGVDVLGYIEAHDVGTEGRVCLEGIVEEALERCMTQNGLDTTLPALASNYVNVHIGAVRKKMLFKKWESEMAGLRLMQQQVTARHLSHQWYYSEHLKQRTSVPPLLPGRNQLLAELRNCPGNLIALGQNLAELRDKYNTLTANVTQRLKWAAGSNPNIAEALNDFTNSVDVGVSMVGSVLRSCEEVTTLCNAVLHYEALRTNTVEALTADNNFTLVLNKCLESCNLIERFPSSISSQEELLVTLSPLSGEVTSAWVQTASTAVSDHIEILTKQVRDESVSLQFSEEEVRSCVSLLRLHLSSHHKLMTDVRVLLKTMARFEKEGGIDGVDAYLKLYKEFSESMSSLVRQLLQEPLTQERVSTSAARLDSLVTETAEIYDRLLGFGEENEDKDTPDVDRKSPAEGGVQTESRGSRSSVRRQSSFLMSPAKTSSPEIKSKTKRYPLTGKAVQEHNEYALNVWKRVKVKLEGRDPDPSRVASVTEQVDYTIREATSIDNLATLYEGWTPWV